MLVGQSQLLTTANSLDDLRQQAIDVLDRYYHQSQDLQASGGLVGQAGGTNILTAEEIQHAQMKIHTRWEQVIQLLRSNTANYGETDIQNASNIASVASDLRYT